MSEFVPFREVRSKLLFSAAINDRYERRLPFRCILSLQSDRIVLRPKFIVEIGKNRLPLLNIFVNYIFEVFVAVNFQKDGSQFSRRCSE
jgi:hypothetical protein